jgi:hypothetical protein
MNVIVVEVTRGRNGKRWPARQPTSEQRNQWRWMIHGLVCRDGNSIRRAQAIMLAEHGVRRSLGALHRDLARYECPQCRQGAGDG